MMIHPAYTWTDSYPRHTNPTAKEVDRGMNSPFYPWPYASNHHCYPIPQGCHSCCNHSCFGGPYGFTSPYPHYPPPPPFYPHGFYSPFPGAHPAYSYPPPHYSIEQPRYDYDKNTPTPTPTPHHCPGCEKKSSIGPQQQPEVDKKTNESLVPVLKDYPHPIMWVPPASYMNTESNAKEKEKENHSRDPVLKPLQPSNQEGNGGVDNRFPFPIFWLPSKNNQVGKDMKEDNVDEKTRKNAETESENSSSKHGVQKVIPVKQLETKEEKITNNGKEEKKVSQKSSKLPPVCLRIDPLPKKKNSSRSPSPPADKERSRGSTTEDVKSFRQPSELTDDLKNSNQDQHVINDAKKEQQPGATDGLKHSNQDQHVINDAKKEQQPEATDGLKHSNQERHVINDAKEVENVDTYSEKGVERYGSSEVEGSKVDERKILSENEAALIIQSVYRGFEVRKSQPLMKLRKITEVGKQVVELGNRIKDLELSLSTTDDKQKLIIGETIMSLLLKLDTIQGLHPIVRDIRKSVAKELVGLQEKLDALTFVKTETQNEETKQVMHPEKTQPQSEEEATESQNNEDAQVHNTNLELQLELQNEDNNNGTLNTNPIPTLVELELSVDVEDHEVEATHLVEQELNYNGQVQMDFETMESDIVEARDTDRELQVESEGKQSTVELAGDQLEMVEESEPRVEKETPDQTQVLNLENVVENKDSAHVCVSKEEATKVDDVEGGSVEDIGGDGRLMEENVKLRVAVEELMKAGSEQVGVIKELTGRVKDLEKKLSKKKRRKVKKCRGSRRSVVEQELTKEL